MKIKSLLTLVLTLAIAPVVIHAADPAPAASTAANEPKAPHSVPFRGTISAVDATAGTFTIANKDNTKVRVFTLASGAKITREDKDVTLADVKAGDYARGAGLKVDDNKFEVKTVKIGQKTADELAADQAKKDKKAAKGK